MMKIFIHIVFLNPDNVDDWYYQYIRPIYTDSW